MKNSWLEKLFPLLIIAIAALAIAQPELFIWLKPHIPLLLGIIMFCIGLTLKGQDFHQVVQLRWQIICLAILKYLTLPAAFFCIGHLVQLSSEDFLGLMIISACPGGTAAGVMSFLSRSTVAVTIVLTFITTLLSPIITPTIIYLFFHHSIHVPFPQIVHTLFWVILFPMLDGLIIRKLLGRRISNVQPLLLPLATLCIMLAIACIVALNHTQILAIPTKAITAVTLANLMGLLIGYIAAKKIFKLSAPQSRAVAFEFGMFDVGIAVMLATKFFTASVAVCGALMSAIQNITGSILVRRFNHAERGRPRPYVST